MNIILCGLPGSGKSTIASLLSKDYDFIEIDALIEKKEGKPCRELYAEKGVETFREIEHQIIAGLKPNRKSVISLGGGSFERKENIAILDNLGMIVYLKGHKELRGLPAYLDPDDPKGSFERLAASRIPTFEAAADVTIEIDGLTPEEIARRVTFPIYIGMKPLLKILKSLESSLYAIITDSNVASLYGKPLESFLKEEGLEATLITIPAGEDFKTRQTKEACENELLKLGAGRDTCVIGLGGGVVTDLAGFVAATYCRGIPAIMIPTSLLGMVDASIGGKTGINVPEGKNLIGTITQPKAIFIDSTKLETLPLDEIKNGVAEMIKHALIADKKYFHFLKTHAKDLLKLDISLMNQAIWQSVLIKTGIVAEDETETGKRRLLNLGHTYAHAIETATKYAIPHGRAVAIGTLAECRLAVSLGHLSKTDFEEIEDIFRVFEMDLNWKNPLTETEFFDLMQIDKKSVAKVPRFVILREVGNPISFDGQFCTAAPVTFLH